MTLLPDELRRRLPLLYATEGEEDPVVQAKFFAPWTTWTWYVTEFDGEALFFGYVIGLESELGYFSLRELGALSGPVGLGVERDAHFKPTRLSEVKRKLTGVDAMYAHGRGGR